MEKLQGRIVLPEQPYEIIIGRGACKKGLAESGGQRFFVVDAGVPDLPDLPDGKILRVPGGETVKTLKFVNKLTQRLVLAGIRREDTLIVIGGGAVLDMAGMVAGLLFRGIRLVFCPTTATAMVDAGTGGKTGVNLPQGKNMAGMFKHADRIVADPDFLLTLDARDLYAGLFEAIKTGLLAGGDLWDFIGQQHEALLSRDPDAWSGLIGMCLRFKTRIVEEDPLDTGARHILNLGHTIGHGLEAVTRFRVFRHGEAVLIGLIAIIEVARARNMMGQTETDRILEVISRFPVPKPLDLDIKGIHAAIELDKKTGKWILLEGIGSPVVISDVTRTEIEQAIKRAWDFLNKAPHAYEIHGQGPLVLVVHGPNMGRLGNREPSVYGDTTYLRLVDTIREYAEAKGLDTIFFQSDHEGELVSAINHFADMAAGIVINPGAFTHTSVALRDALSGTGKPVAEVHISRVSEREVFRRTSLIKPITKVFVEGEGINGYLKAIDRLSLIFFPSEH